MLLCRCLGFFRTTFSQHCTKSHEFCIHRWANVGVKVFEFAKQNQTFFKNFQKNTGTRRCLPSATRAVPVEQRDRPVWFRLHRRTGRCFRLALCHRSSYSLPSLMRTSPNQCDRYAMTAAAPSACVSVWPSIIR